MSKIGTPKTNDFDLARSTKDLAEEVVRLISDGSETGLQKALSLLNKAFRGKKSQVALAYEKAALVVVKRSLDKSYSGGNISIVPKADCLAIEASKALAQGDLPRAFLLLKEANSSGVRKSLCRQVVLKILNLLPKPCRVSILSYGAGVSVMEVGLVAGTGLVILSDKIHLIDNSELNHAHLEVSKSTLNKVNWTKYISDFETSESLKR